jgi:hypothetical protein
MQPWVKWLINRKMRIVVQVICVLLFPVYIVSPLFANFREMLGDWKSDWKQICRLGR